MMAATPSFAFEAPLPLSKPLPKSVISLDKIPVPLVRPVGREANLSKEDQALYKAIFKAQEQADWDRADDLFEKLSDLRLRGHIRFQRLMHVKDYRATYEELYGWLNLYRDHPGAHEVYRLASIRHKKGEPLPLKPDLPRRISGAIEELRTNGPSYISTKKRARYQYNEVKSLQKRTRYLLKLDRPTQAYRELKASKALNYADKVEIDRLKADIAASYLYVGKSAEALELSVEAFNRSGENVPRAGWIAGLTSWHLKDYIPAIEYFNQTSQSKYSSTWTKAAAAFWASRSALKAKEFGRVSSFLREAAKYDRTFYGVLAREALNEDLDFYWGYPPLTPEYLDMITSYPQGLRAALLTQAGQPHLASLELSRLHPLSNQILKKALVAFALNKELANFALRFASVFTPDETQGRFYDAALYPLGSWIENEDYSFDKAFVHGVIRQESRFNAAAESPSLAQGLMQILPSTAGWVIGNQKRFRGKSRHDLKDPVLNLKIGQLYLSRLLKTDNVQDDLVSLAIAYNAGPGNLNRWQKNLSDLDDALLFIEMIPVAETRAYVERVLANYWIYKKRLGQETPSLTQMASGHWPKHARKTRHRSDFKQRKTQSAPRFEPRYNN